MIFIENRYNHLVLKYMHGKFIKTPGIFCITNPPFRNIFGYANPSMPCFNKKDTAIPEQGPFDGKFPFSSQFSGFRAGAGNENHPTVPEYPHRIPVQDEIDGTARQRRDEKGIPGPVGYRQHRLLDLYRCFRF